MRNIFLIGYMGSGKTTLGKKLSSHLNMAFVDLDAFIEQRHFKTVSQIFEEKGEAEFRKLEQTALHEVSQFQNTIISTGGGTPCFFDNMAMMNKNGLTVYLHLLPQELAGNLRTAKTKRPLIKNKSDEELLHFIEQNLEMRSPYYLQAKLTIDPLSSIDEIIERISSLK